MDTKIFLCISMDGKMDCLAFTTVSDAKERLEALDKQNECQWTIKEITLRQKVW